MKTLLTSRALALGFAAVIVASITFATSAGASASETRVFGPLALGMPHLESGCTLCLRARESGANFTAVAHPNGGPSRIILMRHADKTDDPDNQSLAFSGAALTPGMKLWSKAGWVSWARNDAALIELPGGGRVIIVTFTDGREHANNRAIIPALVKRVLANLP